MVRGGFGSSPAWSNRRKTHPQLRATPLQAALDLREPFHNHQMGCQARFPPTHPQWGQNSSRRRGQQPRLQAAHQAQTPLPKNWGQLLQQHQGSRSPPTPIGTEGPMVRVHLPRGGWISGGRSHLRGRQHAIRQGAEGRLRWVKKPDHKNNGHTAPNVVFHYH